MLAEKRILASDTDMVKIILRSSFIWGKGAPQLHTIMDKVKNGGFLWIDRGEPVIDMVHKDNVAEAIALACIKGQAKGIYFVTDDEPKPAKRFLSDLLRTQGVAIGKKSITSILANPLAAVVEYLWRVLRLKSNPPITRFEVAFLAMPRAYDISKIKKELSYQPVVNFRQGLKELE